MIPERFDAIPRGLQFGKTMVWEVGGLRFPRPVRWRLALLGRQAYRRGELLQPSLSRAPGEDHVTPRNTWSCSERRGSSRASTSAAPASSKGSTQSAAGATRSAAWDEAVNLVEWPSVLEGASTSASCVSPRGSSRRRCSPISATSRSAAPGSRSVANGGDPALVRTGNERVLEGRLEDAAFTFERDAALGVAAAERLGEITFFAGAGKTFADKTQRLVGLVRELGGDEVAVEAARLAKADQASEPCGSFRAGRPHRRRGRAARRVPGRRLRGDRRAVLPGRRGRRPADDRSRRVLAAADKLDTLATAFRVGQPTGSRDPYALRRAAIGLAAQASARRRGSFRIEDAEVRDFVEERLESLLDVPVESVRAARGAGLDDLRAIAELTKLGSLPDERLAPVHEVYTRAARIVGDSADAAPVNRILLREDAERELADALDAFEPTQRPARLRSRPRSPRWPSASSRTSS